MKKHILSLTLGSLLVSTLSAEDDGFYMSAGYQIGEAAQMVKNTKGIQELSDNYENLNNLLTKYSTLNTLIKLSSDPSAINGVRNDLGASAAGLLNDKKNSPAYQAVLLAINAAVGFWNIVGYVTQCGGNANGTKSTSSTTIFDNEPGYRSTSITCSLNGYIPGYYGPMSIENFKKLNEAYQILQTALKQGLPTLNEKNGTVSVTYSYKCAGEGNDNCNVLNSNGNSGTKSETQTIDGKTVNTTISSKVVKWSTNGNTQSYTDITTKMEGVPDNAQALLAQASTLINTINTACPYFHAPHSQANGPKWEWPSNKLCGAFSEEISAIQKMITDAQEMLNQANIVSANGQSSNPVDSHFNPFTGNTSFAEGMLANAQAQAQMLNLANQVGQTINPNNLTGTFQNFVKGFLATCNNPSTAGTGGTQGSPPGTVTTQTFASGCAYVGETITALNNSIAHFGAQAEQIQQAEDLAYTLANFSSQYKKLGDTYNSITTAISSLPNAQAIQNVVSKKNNPYSPQGIQENLKTFNFSLSLSLSFLLHAEDDGFYMSAGYQIGEAAQMVKNTKGIQELSENYEKLNNLLSNYNTLNTLIKLSADPSAINDARDNLGSSSRNLLDIKTNSPAYQAVLLALNAAVGLWQVTSYAFTACGPGSNKSANGGIQTFNNVPGQDTTTITCNSYYEPGHGGPISTENYAIINKAYQIIQKALIFNGSNGEGIPVLSNTTTKLDFTIQGDKITDATPNETISIPMES
ncbi:SabA family sialic acid-binding adhesin [Helicobacter pylori]|uniref:SabA family sialic acid-binding adhesin n=1 Tax=Helicobacter pylori TaxID=210 RepID=UPI000B28BB0A|nr:SabA family sialic acid-binding adhesin [Helicobacter pylori]